MSITTQYFQVKDTLPKHVQLIAVSKTHPIQKIQTIYDVGHRAFGENKVQELVDKAPELPNDIQWHLIGHLQTNKVKYIAEFVHLIHAVDSLKLLKEINKQAQKHHRVIDCLLQVKIAQEDSKYGLSESDLYALLDSKSFKEMQNISIKGLMGMASFVSDETQVKSEFQSLQAMFGNLKQTHSNFEILSMGMSGDYPLAIECGSNMVRVGSAIFGVRDYGI